MKKFLMIAGLAAATLLFTGCGGGHDDVIIVDPGPGPGPGPGLMTTLFLIDMNGFSAGGVHYVCVDPEGFVVDDTFTPGNGEFSFYPGDRCTFDFLGFGGTPIDPLYIIDDIGAGKGDIPYECMGGDGGMTYYDGGFEYLPDDTCTFYL